MHTVYHLNADELDDKFLEALKMLFAGKSVEIIISEVDETDYLLRSDANRRRLLHAIENVNRGEQLVEAPLDLLQ